MTRALDEFRATPLQRVTLAGSELTYRVFGDGPAVLFVHGWPLSGITYRHPIEALRPHYRCIVPDLPGAGDTPWSPSIRESVSDFTTILHAFVDHLKLDRLAFVAHDSGGGIARLVAAELGSRVTALVLQNTEIPDHMPLLLRLLKLAAKTPLAPQLQRLVGNRAFRQSPLVFGECFGDRALIEGEFFDACVKPLLRDMSGHNAMLAHYDLGWTRRLAAAHARIQAPIHLFWGGSDKFFPLERARAMRSQFTRGGELEVIPHGKLYVHEEAPEALSRFTLAQLQRAFSSDRAGALAS